MKQLRLLRAITTSRRLATLEKVKHHWWKLAVAVLIAVLLTAGGPILGNPTVEQPKSAFEVAIDGGVAVKVVNAAPHMGGVAFAAADYTADGTNDHVEIQAAIDALPSSGGRIVLLGGIFVGGQIELNKANVHIYGLGPGATIYKLADGLDQTYPFNVTGDGSSINDLTIDGNKANQSAWTVLLRIVGPGGARFVGRNLEVKNSYGDGIFSRAEDVVLINPYAHDNTDTGIVFGGATTGSVYAHRNIAIRPIAHDNGVGLDISNDADYVSIVDAVVYDNTSLGIRVTYTASGTRMPNYVTIDNPYVLNNGGDVSGNAGISFVYSGSVGSAINRPVMVGNSRNGISSASAIKITNPQIQTSFWHGISMTGGKSSVIGGEIFNNSQASVTYSGIEVSGADYTILGVLLYDDQGTPTQKYHIKELAGSDNNMISLNNVRGAVGAGGAKILVVGSATMVRDNPGYVTENYGSSTGTGAQQAIAHGLAATPTVVILWDIENNAGPYQSAAADATNIYITAGNTLDYGWEAKVR